MNGALFFLLARSLRGRLIRWIRLMRRPKYLVGFLVGFFWFALWFGSAFLGDTVRFDATRGLSRLASRTPLEMVPILYGGAVVLAGAITLWWLVPFGRATLELKENELNLLLPTPLSRRDLLQYAVIKHQPGIFFGAVIMAVFLTRGTLSHRLWMLATFWGLLTLWNLHSRGRGLWVARLQELSTAAALRARLVALGSLAAFWLLLAPGLSRLFGLLRNADLDRWPELLASSLARGGDFWTVLAGWLLHPLALVLQPMFSPPETGFGGRLLALAPVLALIVIHNSWVVRSRVRFEEAALRRAREKAAQASGSRHYGRASLKSRQRYPFVLAPVGIPEVGILWKNLLQVHRLPLKLLLPAGFLLVTVPVAVASIVTIPSWLAGALFFTSWVLLIAAPFLSIGHWRNDLRTDLLQLDLVKSWPIQPWRLVVAEILGPTVLGLSYAFFGGMLLIGLTSAVQLAGAGQGRFAVVSETAAARMGAGPISAVIFIVAGAIPVLAALTCLSTTLQNVLALTFPGWVQLGPRHRQTAARMGQNLLLAMGMMISLVMGLLPGLLLVGGLLVLQLWVFNLPFLAVELPLLGLLISLPVVLACGLLSGMAASGWQRLDPSSELLAGEL